MLTRLLCFLIMLALLTACKDHSPSDQDNIGFVEIKPVPKYLQNGMPELKDKETLSIADDMTPAEWLLVRYQDSPQHDATRTKQYYENLLTRIQGHVHENKRVIANRVVQITNKLNENALPTDQEMLLTSFAQHLEQAQKDYVFGEIVDNYSNIRTMGLSHDAAMKRLFELLEG